MNKHDLELNSCSHGFKYLDLYLKKRKDFFNKFSPNNKHKIRVAMVFLEFPI